jgi:pyruvate-ferredoxin/flavodoxin oxidoreductase
MLVRSHPDEAAKLLAESQEDVERQWSLYSARAAMPGDAPRTASSEKAE